MKDIFIKTITLLTFSCLIIGFVAYQAGYFEGENEIKQAISLSPNGSALNNQVNTIPQVDTLKNQEIFIRKPHLMPSSKMMIIRPRTSVKDSLDQLKMGFVDSLFEVEEWTYQLKIDSLDSIRKVREFMYSSKSGPVLSEEDIRRYQEKFVDRKAIDSVHRSMTEYFSNKDELMPSSKVKMIFNEEDVKKILSDSTVNDTIKHK